MIDFQYDAEYKSAYLSSNVIEFEILKAVLCCRYRLSIMVHNSKQF